jgi:hypothetical protein
MGLVPFANYNNRLFLINKNGYFHIRKTGYHTNVALVKAPLLFFCITRLIKNLRLAKQSLLSKKTFGLAKQPEVYYKAKKM